MPKTISTALKAYLAQDSYALALLVRVDRTDGVTLGFTGWDNIIVFGGTTYWPTISLSPSAIKTNSDLTTDQMDVIGAIDSTLITEEDIDAGRYDLAFVSVMRCNPYDLTMGVIVDLTGYMGELTYGEGNFTAMLNSLGTKANQQLGDIITPSCRVNQLGDSQCKVNIASYQFSGTVVSASGSTLTFTDSHASGYYTYGMVRFKSLGAGGGANHDLSMEIKQHTLSGSTATIVLQEPMPFAVNAGDTVILEAGCDRRPITCRNKFSNLVNIHAEPYVPGNDSLLITGRPPSG